MTGFYRTGTCETGPLDAETHVICAQVTAEFLTFTKSRGNDLTTPAPGHGFPGLKPGDRWCLCATRWREALEAGVAPPVILTATHRGRPEICVSGRPETTRPVRGLRPQTGAFGS